MTDLAAFGAPTALFQFVDVLPPVAYSLIPAEKPPFAVTVEPVLALIAAHSLGETASEIVIPIVSPVPVPKMAEPEEELYNLSFVPENVAIMIPKNHQILLLKHLDQ